MKIPILEIKKLSFSIMSGYLRELCDDYGISFYLYNKFKRGTIKKSFKMDFFFLQQNL